VSTGYIDGEPIEATFVNENEIKATIENILKDLRSDNIPLENITILTPQNIERTGLLKSVLIKNYMDNGLDISTIQSYKGLENNFVIITGFRNLTSSESQKLLYVAISRARLKLFIVMANNIKQEYETLIKNNIDRM
jgi:superfamily I DNA/RNA helicase